MSLPTIDDAAAAIAAAITAGYYGEGVSVTAEVVDGDDLVDLKDTDTLACHVIVGQETGTNEADGVTEEQWSIDVLIRQRFTAAGLTAGKAAMKALLRAMKHLLIGKTFSDAAVREASIVKPFELDNLTNLHECYGILSLQLHGWYDREADPVAPGD